MLLERSSDLVNWRPLQTNSLGSAPLYFRDPSARASAAAGQFYRVRPAP